MPIADDDVRYIAGLAKLDLDDAEVERFGAQLETVLEHVRSLDELDTSGVEPTAAPTRARGGRRPDEPRPSLEHDSALRVAPDAEDGCFRVPQVLR